MELFFGRPKFGTEKSFFPPFPPYFSGSGARAEWEEQFPFQESSQTLPEYMEISNIKDQSHMINFFRADISASLSSEFFLWHCGESRPEKISV